jgi:hypothetical protein
LVLHGSDVGAEHQIELAGVREAFGRAAGRAGVAFDLVFAETLLAGPAIDERVAETGDVATGLPNAGGHQDGGVEADDVVTLAHHAAPPGVFNVALQLNADGAVVPGGAEAAVDLAAGKDEAAALGEGDERLHVDASRRIGGHDRSLRRCPVTLSAA